MKRQSQKSIDARIERLYRAACSGVQIPILAIGGVFDTARAAIAAGGDDSAVTAAIVAHVTTIRVN